VTEFFVPPHPPGDPDGDETYEAILDSVRETNPTARIGPRRIYRLECSYRHEPFTVEVGQPERSNDETVVAILDSDPYFVYTASRGVDGGRPIYVSAKVVKRVVLFDD
jgi:hypothetical protein